MPDYILYRLGAQWVLGSAGYFFPRYLPLMQVSYNQLFISRPEVLDATSFCYFYGSQIKAGKRHCNLENEQKHLVKCFWKECAWGSDAYFVCSIGEASPNTVRKHILSPG
jgi:hypothetical protein